MDNSESLSNMIGLVAGIIVYLKSITHLFIFLFGYTLLVFMPIISYIGAYKNFKTLGEQDKSAKFINGAFAHLKASGISITTVVIASLVFVFIFKTVIGLDGTTEEIVKKVLMIDSVFNG